MPGYFNKTSYSPASPATNKVPTTQAGAYRPLLSNGNLKSFYDDIVYWEIAKNNNKFFVTFMRGEYAIPNNKQESIATMEISYPHTTKGNPSTSSFGTGFSRTSAEPEAFLVDAEFDAVGSVVQASHNYNGFIPITELNGVRFFESSITSSISEEKTYHYEIHDSVIGSTNISKTVIASYFYPFSNHQLSVLRDEPTLVVNMDKENELNDGPGDSGFVVIPQNCHEKVKNNVEYYLEKAGLVTKTTRFKNQSPRR